MQVAAALLQMALTAHASKIFFEKISLTDVSQIIYPLGCINICLGFQSVDTCYPAVSQARTTVCSIFARILSRLSC